MLLASGSNITIKIWDTAIRKEVQTLEVPSVTFSQNLKLLASGSGHNITNIWDTVTRKEV
jgi:WD40 repeat protein